MTLPANIRVNVKSPFPALVQGASFIAVSKLNGVYTIAPNYPALGRFLGSIPSTAELVIYNPATGLYSVCTISQLLALGQTQRIVRTSADLPILASDNVLNLNLSAPLSITIPLASSRSGSILTFYDVAGTWGGANTPTFTASGSDTFDGLTSLTGKTNYGWIEFIPLNDGVSSGYKIRASL